MRRLTAGLFVTLDGVVESPERWPVRHFDAGLQALGRIVAQSDAILLGRRTYQELATQNHGLPIAQYVNETRTYVVSSTLEVLDSANSILVSGDLTEEVTGLKELPGRDILVLGSPSLVRSLLRDGLLDELALIVHPIVAGSGTRLFDDLSFGTALQLVDSHTFDTGVVSLTFQPRVLAAAA